MLIIDLLTDLARTPAECYVYRKLDVQILALQRSAMCRERHTDPLERGLKNKLGSTKSTRCYKHVAPAEQRYAFWV